MTRKKVGAMKKRFGEMSQRVSNAQPIVSVVVPVFNAASYLHDCISSLISQTLTDVEFIFVDDCSEDDSRKIIEKYAQQDKRIVSLMLNNNSGAFVARKIGVATARAPYVTFLDPDDTLSPDACRLFAEAMQETGADIVHGGMEILNKNNLPKERIDVVERMVCPKINRLEGRAIIQALAIDGKINPGLCGKAYRASIVKRANEMIPDGRYRRAQDYLVNFITCCMADRYVSFQETVYQYGYGQGFFGAIKRDIAYYRTMCSQVDILPPLRSVVERAFPNDSKVLEALQMVEDKLIGGCFSQIFTLLSSAEDRRSAFSLLLEKVGGLRLAEVLAKRNYANKEKFALTLDSLAAVPKIAGCKVRRVGFFYYHLTPGGVQRVITKLIPIYRELGCEVVLFLEKQIDESCFDVVPGVRIEYLPVVGVGNRNEIGRRLKSLASAIEKYGVDLLYYHAFLSPNLLWDMLVCKWVCHVPIIIHYHTATSYRARATPESYLRWPGFMKIFSFAEGVITLSKADEAFMRICGVSARYIPNPIPFDNEPRNRLPRAHNEIVWVARFSREKHPSDPVKILSIVRECIPDATLTIVGSGPDSFIRELRATIVNLGLSKAVTMVGEQKDVRPYYERAAVYLHTSNLEGFPVSLVEAAFVGLPIVMYTLPWLEIVRGNDGIIQVPQSDLKAAAAAIVSILTSQKKSFAMSVANQKRVCEISAYDFLREWRCIFDGMENGDQFSRGGEIKESDLTSLCEQIMHCYARGIIEEENVRKGSERERQRLKEIVQQRDATVAKLKADYAESMRHRREIWAARDKMKEQMLRAKREVSSLKTSEAYRVGMFVTWPARKAWGGVKCLRENGVKYTAKHAVGKVLRVFGSNCKW